MNAKETLEKMFNAISSTLGNEKEVQEVAEATEAVVETEQEVQQVEEAVAEPTEAVKEEAEEAVAEPAEPMAEEPKEEAEGEEVKAEEPEDDRDARIKELERQLSGLSDMIKGALTKPEEVEEVIPELPQEEPKGLTHSPEAEVAKRAPKIGSGKGGSIQSSVYRYINNK